MTPHRSWIATFSIIATMVTVASAQTPQPSSKDKATSDILTLSGCVAADPHRSNLYTLSDGGDPTVYKLTGASVRKYVGQHVEVSGVAPKRLKIVGGLYPSPNVAGQAGAIDPTKAAMAAQTEPNAANVEAMTEIRVRSVRAVPGSCPDK
jgi:hypothetical protein